MHLMNVTSVAIIGAGTMGKELARHLLRDGYDVFAFDIDPAPLRQLDQLGATIADSSGSAATNADCSIVAVGTYDNVESVLCADDGILANANEDHVIALSDTLLPDHCIDLGAVAREQAMNVIDAPLSGNRTDASNGELRIFLGGPEDIVQSVHPVFSTFAASGEDVVHFGNLGSGQVVKAVNNALLWINYVGDYEALSLAHAYDVDVELLCETLLKCGGSNWVLTRWGEMYSTWAYKDMEIFREMAERKAQPKPLAMVADQLVKTVEQDFE